MQLHLIVHNLLILVTEASFIKGTHAIPSSNVPSGRKEGTLKLKKKDIGLREETKLLNEAKSVKELEYLRKSYERKAQTILQEHLLKLKKAEEEAEFASRQLLENDAMQTKSPRTIFTPRKHLCSSSVDSKSSILGSIRETHVLGTIQLGSKWQNLKQRQSLHAIEEKKKAKLKMKKEKEHVVEETASMDSFVVVKCSLEYCIMG
ncbi:hypothetical protein RJT34_01440 [Clitoria ternatea]|uniref:Uncharacterized protein n=1 Tax=Clitoria ternatea TaxID=43366 RepID=A0AAN9KKB2_CLITE